ncbi:MAG: HAD-IIA family hydrolase [Ardenticatenaceae bacterium]|nr:HAD-IIA family hydrolase [Ardenticatenaceae bacterium]MCB9444874.1 HAD-IIA family hydrolase [Ardenticatenaceae bacterium]
MKFYDAYIFDLDGTVYLGDALLPSAGETITRLREMGKRTVFLSNNPTKTREAYAAKLTKLGLPTPETDVINSSYVMIDFLKRRLSEARLFVVGETSLCSELERAGFEITDDARRVDAVIASFDRTFVYQKLQVAFDAVRGGARFFATNADRYCPVPGGGEPDAAAMIAAIEACTNTKVEAVVGKPSAYMAEAILSLLAMSPKQCVITGDRLETDVLMGLQAGMAGALTLTGATDGAALAASEIKPTYVLRQLSDLLPEA